jgi:hypothetical protein
VIDINALPQLPEETGERYVLRHPSDLVNRYQPGSPCHALAFGLDSIRRAIGLKHRTLRQIPAAPAAIPLLLLLITRLDRAMTRFARVVARGTPPRDRKARTEALRTEIAPAASNPSEAAGPADPAQAPDSQTAAAKPQQESLPRKIVWLTRLVPEARYGRGQLAHVMDSPALIEQLARTPQLGRILRGLCHLLDIAIPKHLRLPRRPRTRRPRLPGAGTRRRPARAAQAAQAHSSQAPTALGVPRPPPMPDFTPHSFAEGSVVLTPSLALGPGARPGGSPALSYPGHAFPRDGFFPKKY